MFQNISLRALKRTCQPHGGEGLKQSVHLFSFHQLMIAQYMKKLSTGRFLVEVCFEMLCVGSRTSQESQLVSACLIAWYRGFSRSRKRNPLGTQASS
jgi:hypothetical protein